MKPPIVYDETMPSSHSTSRITKMVHSMIPSLGLAEPRLVSMECPSVAGSDIHILALASERRRDCSHRASGCPKVKPEAEFVTAPAPQREAGGAGRPRSPSVA